MESTEEWVSRNIENGFIKEDGTPIKCVCGNTDFKRVDCIYGEGHIEEYSLECIKCDNIVGYWAYGHWQV